MKAMILAAGLGTRLKPLTNDKPKALIKIGYYTLLELAIRKLEKYHFNEIIINTHHFAEQIATYLDENRFNANITISLEKDKLLDTGGGLKNASWFFDDNKPFLVFNVDIISNINLTNLLAFHISNRADITLATRYRESSRYLYFNEKKILTGWKNLHSGKEIITHNDFENSLPFAFNGIQIIDPNIFDFFPQENVFSIIEFYLSIAKQKKIINFEDKSNLWFDCGKIDVINKLKSVNLENYEI